MAKSSVEKTIISFNHAVLFDHDRDADTYLVFMAGLGKIVRKNQFTETINGKVREGYRVSIYDEVKKIERIKKSDPLPFGQDNDPNIQIL